MTYYQVDAAVNQAMHTNLRNMENVLAEVAMTYRILEQLLVKYREADTIPGIEAYRLQLEQLVSTGIHDAELIAANTQKFSQILAELGKELAQI
jgi:hypothetical protein